jgi:hypothetical protein
VERTTLNNVAGGAAAELFEHELQKVLANIADDEMPATATREITLKISFKPSATRQEVAYAVTADSKLPKGIGGTVGLMYVVNDDGELKASNSNPKQLKLTDQLQAAKERRG